MLPPPIHIKPYGGGKPPPYRINTNINKNLYNYLIENWDVPIRTNFHSRG